MNADSIFIEALTFDCIIGVLPPERITPQPLRIDLRFELPLSKAAASESLEDTIDYGAIADHVRSFVMERRFMLLETLAEETVRTLLADSRIDAVELTVRKPLAIPGADAAGVRIYRRR